MGTFTGSDLISKPTEEPITVTDVKNHLVIESNEYDGRLQNLIKQAREYVEEMTGYRLITQGIDLYRDKFDNKIEVPYAPLISVSSVTYYDSDNNSQSLSSSVYDVLSNLEPSIIQLANGQSWPSLYDREDAVVIRVSCGYTDATKVPEHFRQMILLYCSWIFDNDEAAKRTLNYMIASRKLNWLSSLRV